jgi:hypothetical protein
LLAPLNLTEQQKFYNFQQLEKQKKSTISQPSPQTPAKHNKLNLKLSYFYETFTGCPISHKEGMRQPKRLQVMALLGPGGK